MNIYSFWLRCLRLYHILALTGGVRAFGQDSLIPGAKIIITNHPNATDYFILPLAIPYECCYLMEPYLIKWPVVGWIHRSTGQVPVYRGQSKQTLQIARERVAEGKTIIIMPEGEISPEGGYCQPKVGATLLALQTGVPIIPAGIFVPEKYRRVVKIYRARKIRTSKIQLFGPSYVKFGEAWYPPSQSSREFTREEIRNLTDFLMGKVVDLVEQARVLAVQNEPLFENIISLLWQRGFQR